jgi:hypothetical protein
MSVFGLSACSQSEVAVKDTSWQCENGARLCLVNFTIESSSDFVLDATVKMRAYARNRVGDAVSIEVVAEDEMKIELSPNEKKHLHHTMTINRGFSQIVISAFSSR